MILKDLNSILEWKDIKSERPLKDRIILVCNDNTGKTSLAKIVDGEDRFYEYRDVFVAILGELDLGDLDRITHWAYIKR